MAGLDPAIHAISFAAVTAIKSRGRPDQVRPRGKIGYGRLRSGFDGLRLAGRRFGRGFFLLGLLGFPAGPLLLLVRHDILPTGLVEANMLRPCADAMGNQCALVHFLAATAASPGAAILARQASSSAFGQSGPPAC